MKWEVELHKSSLFPQEFVFHRISVLFFFYIVWTISVVTLTPLISPRGHFYLGSLNRLITTWLRTPGILKTKMNKKIKCNVHVFIQYAFANLFYLDACCFQRRFDIFTPSSPFQNQQWRFWGEWRPGQTPPVATPRATRTMFLYAT